MPAISWMPEVEEERWLWTVAVTVLMLWLGGPTGYSPDGLEMIALAKSWLGEGPALEAGGYWPPLWPAAVALLSRIWPAVEAGRVLNLALAGLVVWPLHHLAAQLSDRRGARLAVLVYALLPSVREHAPVLDARPLGMFLATAAAAAAVHAACTGAQKNWWWAFFLSMLASLARPEGLLLVPLVGLGALLSGQTWRQTLPVILLSALPSLLRPGSGVRGWEAFTGPWLGIWPNNDLLALFGSNSVPTGYRHFVLAAEASGIEKSPNFLSNLLLGLPGGLDLLYQGLPAAMGGMGLLVSLWGIAQLVRRGWRVALPTLGGVGLLGPIVLLPMARDQATPATNLMFLVPLGCAMIAAAMPLRRRAPTLELVLATALCIGVVAEAHRGPFRGEKPFFFEGTDAAQIMQAWLEANPPTSQKVACRLSARGVVLAAGLVPTPLGSPWEDWKAGEGEGVLLTTVDLRGADGGRGLSLLEDPAWELRAVSFEGQIKAWPAFADSLRSGRSPERLLPNKHWLLYLERRR